MAVEKVVLDASVVAKWYLIEKYSDEALRFRDAHVSGKLLIAAPSLLTYEVLNALRCSGAYSKEELVKAAESLDKYGLEIWELKGRLKEEAARLSFELGVTVYDASYIALASTLKTSLYTADEELAEKARTLNIVKRIGREGAAGFGNHPT